MGQRTCGGCTACCKTHGVYELAKMPGVWCTHCNVGRDCAIYEERPNSCREFVCSWLMGLGLEEHRPDKTKVVPEHKDIPGLGLVLWFYELTEGALGSKFVKTQTRLNLGVGNSVIHLPRAGNPRLYLPAGRDVSELAFRVDMKEVEIIPFEPGRF